MEKAKDSFELCVTNTQDWKRVSNEWNIANSWAPHLDGIKYKVPSTALHNKVIIPVRDSGDIQCLNGLVISGEYLIEIVALIHTCYGITLLNRAPDLIENNTAILVFFFFPTPSWKCILFSQKSALSSEYSFARLSG